VVGKFGGQQRSIQPDKVNRHPYRIPLGDGKSLVRSSSSSLIPPRAAISRAKYALRKRRSIFQTVIHSCVRTFSRTCREMHRDHRASLCCVAGLVPRLRKRRELSLIGGSLSALNVICGSGHISR